MLTALLRPTRRRTRDEHRPLLFERRAGPPGAHHADSDEETEEYDSDEDGPPNPLPNRDIENQQHVPIFSAAHLDRLPVYNLQHSIRLLIVRKVETTLSWEQLRTPQISQFIVKPIQQDIRSSNHSRATLYALLANGLQFQKDAQLNPGTVGISNTRALICELLAMRLLREFSTNELIDALFYDFDPLQGLSVRWGGAASNKSKSQARLSTVEIAIRAHNKRFLAHPLVVQQLEAVWAGTIVFHSVADSLHRSQKVTPQGSSYGAVGSHIPFRNVTYQDETAGKGKAPATEPIMRRAVTLYNPSNASLFKLSRLRVPRYRQVFSTLSYAVMLCLFLSVLIVRSLDISALELVFWFWSAGYMLDELVGFSEQGFGLYIISVWNSFDIGILLLFITYYVLRLYGILMLEAQQKRRVANVAYDVLASTAVLLFPRLFSVLDHYRYFSQLLIAFRMMAVDLVAILILIIISCSGFFVAFTLSFSDDDFHSADAAYQLFQIVMGFTPAAWERWADYNLLGKAIMSIFLIICHFLIVTILITVLTNSFMAIVQNGNEEHQFLFAVNTISMVKSDALFSYVPPTNILGWILSPLRFVTPFRSFLRLNRTIIKLTHIPMLLGIFIYERLVLSQGAVEPTDLIEQRGRQSSKAPAFSIRGPENLFSPGVRLREPSVTTFHKDQALEQVFRQPYPRGEQPDERPPGPKRSMDTRKRESLMRTKSTNVVNDWMRGMGQEGGAASPLEEHQDMLDRLETKAGRLAAKKPHLRRYKTSLAPPVSHYFSGIRSVASDPEEQHQAFNGFSNIHEDPETPDMSLDDLPQHTDADGDDELATNDDDVETRDHSPPRNRAQADDSDKENEGLRSTPGPSKGRQPLSDIDSSAIDDDDQELDPTTPIAPRTRLVGYHQQPSEHADNSPSPERPSTQQRVAKRDKGQHIRTASSATILFAPLGQSASGSLGKTPLSTSPKKTRATRSSVRTSAAASTHTPSDAVASSKQHRRAPTSGSGGPSRQRETDDIFGALLPRKITYSAPNLASLLGSRRKPSFNAMALDLASELGDNRALPNPELLSASVGTQMEMAALHRRRPFRRAAILSDDGDDDDEDDGGLQFRRGGGDTRRLSRLMLERMTNLEHGFLEVLREVKGLNQSRGSRSIAGESEMAASEGRVLRADPQSLRTRTGQSI